MIIDYKMKTIDVDKRLYVSGFQPLCSAGQSYSGAAVAGHAQIVKYREKKQKDIKTKIRNVLFFPYSIFQCEPWSCTFFTKSSNLGCKSVTANFINASRCACVSLVLCFDFTNLIVEKACSHRYIVPKREMNFALNDRNSGKAVTGTAI